MDQEDNIQRRDEIDLQIQELREERDDLCLCLNEHDPELWTEFHLQNLAARIGDGEEAKEIFEQALIRHLQFRASLDPKWEPTTLDHEDMSFSIVGENVELEWEENTGGCHCHGYEYTTRNSSFPVADLWDPACKERLLAQTEERKQKEEAKIAREAAAKAAAERQARLKKEADEKATLLELKAKYPDEGRTP